MQSSNYRNRIIESVAKSAAWAFNAQTATYEEISTFVQDTTIYHGIDDALMRRIYSRYLELVNNGGELMERKE